MKKIIFLACLLLNIVLVSAQVDTLGRYPYFFYNNIPEHWRTGDSVSCPIGMGYSPDGIGSTTESPFYTLITPSVPSECVIKMHTDDTIHVIGVAYSTVDHDIPGTAYPKHFWIKVYDSDMNLLDTTLTTNVDQYWGGSTTLDDDYKQFEIYGRAFPLITGTIDATSWVTLRFSYFPDSAEMDIIGDFYIGINLVTFFNNQGRRAYYGLLHIHESHSEPFHVAYNTYRYLTGKDNEWTEVENVSHTVPMLFPIIRLSCPSVDTVHIADSLGDYGVRCLSATWDSLPQQMRWVVQLEQEGFGTLVTDTVEQCSWSRCGLEPDGIYSVSVSSLCDGLRQSWSPWSRASQTDTLSIATAQVAGLIASITPNPTTGMAAVYFSAQIPAGSTLAVSDMQGHQLLQQAVAPNTQSANVNISHLPHGTYLLTLTTPSATASRLLIKQ